jgi:RimJ/RimL family protein N-acetyltransferase
MIVFETEHLLVRHLQDDDFETFHALCSDPEINRYMGNGEPLTAEQTRTWIKISQENYQKRGNGCFAITSSTYVLHIQQVFLPI